MSKPPIEPRILKGFRDTLPVEAIARQRMVRAIEDSFASFGFAPIDTPALEYSDILLGKGSAETDKQMYRFKDGGDRDVALRFDLTVPLARFVSMYVNDLGLPFKRYHIGSVFRAEKPQRGRYREFIQCDFDILGSESPLADAEILLIVHQTLSALKIRHRVRVNNRKVLNGLLELTAGREFSTAVLRAIDKLEKLGRETVERELRDEAKVDQKTVEFIFQYLAIRGGDSQEILERLSSLLGHNELAARGIAELKQVFQVFSAYGAPDAAIQLDPAIARGLDYYTGTVYETQLLDLPDIGSISSGGRYDDLTSLYSKRRITGVGGSIGLDRILAAYEELQLFEKCSTTAKVFLPLMEDGVLSRVLQLSGELRSAGINTEVYPEVGPLGNQLKYAAKKGVPIVVIIGGRELERGSCNVKIMASGEQIEGVSLGDLIERLGKLLER